MNQMINNLNNPVQAQLVPQQNQNLIMEGVMDENITQEEFEQMQAAMIASMGEGEDIVIGDVE